MNPAAPNRRHCTALLLAAALPGCGSVRRGWESVATLGPPAELPVRGAGDWRPALSLPGLGLRLWLDNSEQEEDSAVVLAVVPAGTDRTPLRTPGAASGRTGIELWATPQVAGIAFDPRAARLKVGSETVAADAGGVSTPFVLRADGRLGREPPPLQPVARPVPLPDPGFTVRLGLSFDRPAPSPRRDDLVLDLSTALAGPALPPLPPIHFRPGRWTVGYT